MSTPGHVVFVLSLAVVLGSGVASQAGSQSGAVGSQASASADAKAQSQGRAEAQPAGADLQAGTQIAAELRTAIDSRKAKPSDQVLARVTKDVTVNGKPVVHKGDRLAGRITSVKADAAAKSGSQITVVFDRLITKQAVVALNTVVTSVIAAPNRAAAEPFEASEPAMIPPASRPRSSGGGGGLLGGVGSTVATTTATVQDTVNTGVTAVRSAPLPNPVSVAASSQTDSHSQGAVAIGGSGLGRGLGSQAHMQDSTAVSSVLSSEKGHVKLEKGTQLEFRTAESPQAKQ